MRAFIYYVFIPPGPLQTQGSICESKGDKSNKLLICYPSGDLTEWVSPLVLPIWPHFSSGDIKLLISTPLCAMLLGAHSVPDLFSLPFG